MIFKFLAAKLFGLPRWVWLAGALALALVFGVRSIVGTVNDTLDEASMRGEQSGRAAAENAGMQTTLEQIGNANEAAAEIRNPAGNARFCQCLRDSAPGFAANCSRYLPDQSVPGDGKATPPPCPAS